ncbi:LPS export ABC transporter periplasmic protein LptC [Shewanella sp. 202IG2-18]|uniref:LPS export ABC transporter periplasmic protein LptC n=1 Tax=Parashewanella hymeniacidonis TaxID=2807618 RepID=UPI00195F6F20|nr:LPS export ABC transporter periplasmic protein LptC [Parashewanella hymeniacidonis]MBM7072255.1 LPS export ABC transporter periplasmic protein LptC [Parashewanella hymeniacidonis]
MNRVTIAIVIFFSTALYLYWQVQVKQGQKQQVTSKIELPDYTATQLDSVAYDEKGQLSSRVTAEHMEHYQDKDLTLFSKPVYLIYGDDIHSPWRITAEQGRLQKMLGKVYLDDSVELKAVNKQEPLQSVITKHLQMDLKTKTMQSDEMVYIKGNGFNSQGRGLYADFNQETVRLKSQVTGTYEIK